MRNALIALLLAFAPACVSVPESPVRVTAVTESFDQAEFVRVVEALIREAPLNAPVRVGVGEIHGPFLGLTSWQGDHYLMLIEARQLQPGIYDTLAHEWAHAMVWDASQEDHHDALWGVAYARCYNIVLEARFAPEPQPAAPEAPQEPSEPECPDDGP